MNNSVGMIPNRSLGSNFLRRPAMLAGLFAVGILLLAGCSRDPQPQAAQFLDSQAREAVEQRAAAILDRSQELTVPAPDGEGYIARERDVPTPQGRYTIPEGLIVRTPGIERTSFPLERLPHSLLIDDLGRLVVAWPERVMVLPPRDLTEPERLLADGGARHLQWNEDASALLLSGPGLKQVLSWPNGEEVWSADPDQELRGQLVFAPEGDGELWLLEELIDFDATAEVRIFWRVLGVPRDGGAARPLFSRDLRVASLGTLPILGTAYGTPRQPYQILAKPGPLVRLDESLRQVEPYTTPSDEVDLRPHADATGRLWFLRATRQVETRAGGGVLGPGARAWSTVAEAEANARRVTAEPTVHVTVSPNGQRVALAVIREGEGLILEADAGELLSRDLSRTAEAESDFRERFSAVAGAVESAFHSLELSRSMEETPFGPMLTEPPTEEDLVWMAGALRSAVERHFEIDLPSDVEALGILDGLISEGDGLWEETPAMVLAIAGFHGGVLAREEGIRWALEMARPEIGLDADEVHFSPGELVFNVAGANRPIQMRVGGITIMHNPFYAARERIAGRMSLDMAAREVLASRSRPVLLTENASVDNLSIELLREAQETGLDMTGEDFETFDRVATEKPTAKLANLAVLIHARQTGDRALALTAGLNLAEELAWTPDGLLLAAEPLHWVGLTNLSLDFARRAETLAPNDPNVVFASAITFYDALEFDEASRRLDRVEELDIEGYYTDTLEHVRSLLAESIQRQARQQ